MLAKTKATKFTEVGYHGRDVDQIIRDLVDVSMQLTRKLWTERLREQARGVVEDRILDKLTGPAAKEGSGGEGRGRESFRECWTTKRSRSRCPREKSEATAPSEVTPPILM
jgi:ATP-dependent HslUV protease ATP-binding subunit HslU